MHILKAYCKAKGIKQKDLAKDAGIDPSYITHIIKGRKIPTVATALLIERATHFEVSAITILGLKSQAN